VVVTGGASGLGLALVRELKENGHTVHVIDKEDCGPGNLKADLGAEDFAAISDFVEKIGHVDTLICNAAVFKFGSLLDLEISEINFAFQVNVFSILRLFQKVRPRLKFLVISSEGVLLPPSPFTWPYLASKRSRNCE
jgi:ribitol 2-dehydrogenase